MVCGGACARVWKYHPSLCKSLTSPHYHHRNIAKYTSWSLQACRRLMSGCRKPLHSTTDRICKPLSSRWAPRWKKNPARRFGRSVLSHHSRSLFTLHFSLGHRLSPVRGGHFRSSGSRKGPRWLIGVAVDTAHVHVFIRLCSGFPLIDIECWLAFRLACVELLVTQN